MSGFSETAFEKRLQELNGTQESIQTLSLWLIHHRKRSKAVVEVWLKEIHRAERKRKLAFIYLANDVIQNGKKKGPEFTKDFSTVLPKALKHTARETDDKTFHSLDRLLKIWEERGIYDTPTMSSLRNSLECGHAAQKKSSNKEGINEQRPTPEEVAAEPPEKKLKVQRSTLREEIERELEENKIPIPDVDALVKAISNLENSPSSDASIREKISSLPPKISEESYLSNLTNKDEAQQLAEEVDEAVQLLVDYNQRLQTELEDRIQLAKMLAAYSKVQRDEIARKQALLLQYREKLDKVVVARNELRNHVTSLPDLSSGLAAPLPTAGDLFTIVKSYATA